MLFAGEKKRLRQAFEREALPHLDSLYGLAVRLTRNERDAEDLVQDTILRAFRSFHRFEAGSNCRAWLFKILHNGFVTGYRDRVRQRALAGTLEAASGAGVLFSEDKVDASRDPEQALVERVGRPGTRYGVGLSDDVREALDSLPEDFRIAVVLCDLEELTYREIADIMDCPIGTVMSRLHRGRRQLQAALRGYAAARGIGGPTDEPDEPDEEDGGAEVIPLHPNESAGGRGTGGAR